MPAATYPMFCPVSMAAELLEPRWTMLVLCEMCQGSSRFNEIHRGVPGMSPTLLSKRLRELEEKGLIEKLTARDGTARYVLTQMAEELMPIVQQLGEWAHRNIEKDFSASGTDANMLMWNLRRKIDVLELPVGQCVIQFTLGNCAGGARDYWIVVKPGLAPDLCFVNKGFDVDLFLTCEVEVLARAWLGHSAFDTEIAAGRIALIGDRRLARSLRRWLVRSSFAAIAPAGTGRRPGCAAGRAGRGQSPVRAGASAVASHPSP